MKRGRPRTKDKLVHSPVDNTTILPYAKKDSAGNYFFSWKDEDGKWRKRNLGRRDNWYQRYLQCEALIINKEPQVILPKLIPPLINEEMNITETENVDEFEITIQEKGKMDITAIVPKYSQSVMSQWARDLIHNNPKKASKLFEIPYDRLLGIGEKKNYTLKEIFINYFSNVRFQKDLKGEKKKELDKVKRSWERFKNVLNVNIVREINKQHINKYYDNIYSQFIREKLSTSWIKAHFEKIKRIFNAAIRDLDYPQDIIEVKRLLQVKLVAPKNVIKNPPLLIKPDDFKKMLKYSNDEEKVMWLLSLNGAYYSTDIADIPISDVDTEDRVINNFSRGKTGEHRCCILWEETAVAIENYLEQTKHFNRETLFVSEYGESYVKNRIRKKFVDVRKQSGLEKYTHSNFRDSFKTVCMIKGVPKINTDVVMGHKPKMSEDSYGDVLAAYPHMAENACKAVYDYYYGKIKNS